EMKLQLVLKVLLCLFSEKQSTQSQNDVFPRHLTPSLIRWQWLRSGAPAYPVRDPDGIRQLSLLSMLDNNTIVVGVECQQQSARGLRSFAVLGPQAGMRP